MRGGGLMWGGGNGATARRGEEATVTAVSRGEEATAARNRKPRAASRSQGWTGGACKQKKSRARRRCTQHQPDSAVSRRQGGATCY